MHVGRASFQSIHYGMFSSDDSRASAKGRSDDDVSVVAGNLERCCVAAS
jgi:hypothetical protein